MHVETVIQLKKERILRKKVSENHKRLNVVLYCISARDLGSREFINEIRFSQGYT